jgi:hypothetical protein
MNPNNIRHPNDRRKVYNDYVATLQMQIDNLAKTEKAMSALKITGSPPVQPPDTRTLNEKLSDVETQKRVLRQALLDITDGAEASKIMNDISDEDIVFLGVAWNDFSNMIKQKFSSGILAPLFNEVLQRYKRDYINTISVQKGITIGNTTEELLLSMRDLLRLMPNAAQLRDLRFTISNVPAGAVPERMRATALLAADELETLIPSERDLQALAQMNPIDRLAAERAFNDAYSSVVSGRQVQDFTAELQQATPKEAPDVLTKIINKAVVDRDDLFRKQQGDAIIAQQKAELEIAEPALRSEVARQKAAFLAPLSAYQKERQRQEAEKEAIEADISEARFPDVEFGIGRKGDVRKPKQPRKPKTQKVSEAERAIRQEAQQFAMIEAEEIAAKEALAAAQPKARKVTKAEKGVKDWAEKLKTKREQMEKQEPEEVAPEKAMVAQPLGFRFAPEESAPVSSVSPLTAQQRYDASVIEDPQTPDTTLVKFSLAALRGWINNKIKEGRIPPTKYISTMPKPELLVIVSNWKLQKYPVSPPPKARKSSVKSSAKASTAQKAIVREPTPFVQVEYSPSITVKKFDEFSYPEKFSILESMESQGLPEAILTQSKYRDYRHIMDRRDDADANVLTVIFKELREGLGMGGKGLPKGKRITFGAGLAKPRMMVKPDNIDLDLGIKKEASYIPIGKYVVNKQKLRDNVLLMRTVKGGQIAELPQMSISPKLGKMLNNIINGRGFPNHDDLANLDDSDKDIMYKVFKMSKAEGIEAIPRPNKTKDEAEFNRFTILKGQILAGNNSKEMIKEFKTLLIKLIHGGKILRKDGHDILLDLAALGF